MNSCFGDGSPEESPASAGETVPGITSGGRLCQLLPVRLHCSDPRGAPNDGQPKSVDAKSRSQHHYRMSCLLDRSNVGWERGSISDRIRFRFLQPAASVKRATGHRSNSNRGNMRSHSLLITWQVASNTVGTTPQSNVTPCASPTSLDQLIVTLAHRQYCFHASPPLSLPHPVDLLPPKRPPTSAPEVEPLTLMTVGD